MQQCRQPGPLYRASLGADEVGALQPYADCRPAHRLCSGAFGLQPYAPRLQPYAPRLQPYAPQVEALRRMLGRLDAIAARAQEEGVRLMVDAEHSYFQVGNCVRTCLRVGSGGDSHRRVCVGC